MSLVARLYEPGDEKQLVELLDTCFPGWPERDLDHSKEDFWRWKYRDNPKGINFNSVALSGEKIISCNHGIFLDTKLGDKTVLGHQASDLATHPDFRRLGATKLMAAMKLPLHKKYGTAFTFTIAENPIVTNVIRKDAPLFPQPLIELVRIHDFNLHLNMTDTSGSWFKLPVLQLIKMSGHILSSLDIPKNISDEFEIKSIQYFDNNVDTLYDSIKHSFNFLIERKNIYLNWRYCDSRGGNYIKLVAKSSEGILGYIVLRINRYRKEYPTAWIVDLFTNYNRQDVASALLSEGLQIIDKNGVNIVRYWAVKGTSFEQTFKNHGFMDVRKNVPSVVVRPRTVGDEFKEFSSSSPAQLHLQAGDTEYI